MEPQKNSAKRKDSRVLPAAILIVSVAVAIGFAVKMHLLPPGKPGRLRLSDGVEVLYVGGTRVSAATAYPKPHEIRVDGDALIREPASDAPLIVRTRLMVLTARGPAEFRVTAHSNETGEQVEVLSGTVEARKAYASPNPEPDMLAAGEMSMVNQTIDLMEKEKTDVADLQTWRDALVASVNGAAAKE